MIDHIGGIKMFLAGMERDLGPVFRGEGQTVQLIDMKGHAVMAPVGQIIHRRGPDHMIRTVVS